MVKAVEGIELRMLAFNMLTQRRLTHGTHERLQQEYSAIEWTVCGMKLLQSQKSPDA